MNKEIELARQSGYNEACYIFEKRVKKLKEGEINKISINSREEQIIRLVKEEIDKIMGNFNSPLRKPKLDLVTPLDEDSNIKKDKGCVTLGTSNCDCVICRRIRALSPKCEEGLSEDKQ